MQVAKILENKGSDVYTIAPDATIETAVAALREHGIVALVVSSNGTIVDGKFPNAISCIAWLTEVQVSCRHGFPK